MRLVGKARLEDFKREHPDAREQLDAWEKEVEAAHWKTPHELKARFQKASLVGKLQAVFDICWNKYRLWVQVTYQTGIVLVRQVGTHKDYNKWDIR